MLYVYLLKYIFRKQFIGTVYKHPILTTNNIAENNNK